MPTDVVSDNRIGCCFVLLRIGCSFNVSTAPFCKTAAKSPSMQDSEKAIVCRHFTM